MKKKYTDSEIFLSRGKEYYVKEHKAKYSGSKIRTIIHDPYPFGSNIHTFDGKVENLVSTSYQCPICDHESVDKFIKKTKLILLNKLKVDDIFYSKEKANIFFVYKNKKYIIRYFDKSFFRNITEPIQEKIDLYKKNNTEKGIIYIDITHLQYNKVYSNIKKVIKNKD